MAQPANGVPSLSSEYMMLIVQQFPKSNPRSPSKLSLSFLLPRYFKILSLLSRSTVTNGHGLNCILLKQTNKQPKKPTLES